MKNVSKIKQELAVIRQRVVELQGYDSFRHEIVMARGEEAIQDLISTEMARKRQHLVDVALQMMLAQGVAPSNNETQVQVLRAQLDRVYERGWVQGYVHACELFYARR
ncbi:MAG: hypothetical protein D6690_10375 [Nitrospirae bacterium]|nr:MAG: hypothetical protein D6690_10375 [Nitrospirota bacterium]